MAAELVQLSRTLFDDLSEHELTMSQTIVYLGLRCNAHVTGHGLYEITIGRLARLVGLSTDLVRNDLQILGGLGLLFMDNGLVFVDAIPKDGRFATWTQRYKSLKSGIKRYRAIRSAAGGDNQAYLAWLEYHAELLADLDDAERIECGLTPTGHGTPDSDATATDYPDPVDTAAAPQPASVPQPYPTSTPFVPLSYPTSTPAVPHEYPTGTLPLPQPEGMATTKQALYTDTDTDTDTDADAEGKTSDLYVLGGGAGEKAAGRSAAGPHHHERNGAHSAQPP